MPRPTLSSLLTQRQAVVNTFKMISKYVAKNDFINENKDRFKGLYEYSLKIRKNDDELSPQEVSYILKIRPMLYRPVDVNIADDKGNYIRTEKKVAYIRGKDDPTTFGDLSPIEQEKLYKYDKSLIEQNSKNAGNPGDIANGIALKEIAAIRNDYLTAYYCLKLYKTQRDEIFNSINEGSLGDKEKLVAIDSIRVFQQEMEKLGIIKEEIALLDATPNLKGRLENECNYHIKKYMNEPDGIVNDLANDVQANKFFDENSTTRCRDKDGFDAFLKDVMVDKDPPDFEVEIPEQSVVKQYVTPKEFSLYDFNEETLEYVKKDPPEGGFARLWYNIKNFFVGNSQANGVQREQELLKTSRENVFMAYLKGRDKSLDDYKVVDNELIAKIKESTKEDIINNRERLADDKVATKMFNREEKFIANDKENKFDDITIAAETLRNQINEEFKANPDEPKSEKVEVSKNEAPAKDGPGYLESMD